jgi:hypothetical protein
MPASKHPKPVTVCPKCGKVSYKAALINQWCGQQIKRDRCTGLIQSAILDNEWLECRTCAGEGCAECYGLGWLSFRRWRYAHSAFRMHRDLSHLAGNSAIGVISIPYP